MLPKSIQNRVFRRSSLDFKPLIPQLSPPSSTLHNTSHTRADFSRPLTSRTILKSTHTTSINSSILPCSSESAVKVFTELLSQYELTEIHKYSQIYYIGKNTKLFTIGNTNNWGFDTLKHHYIIILGDHIAYRYEILDILGKGTFGQVIKCFDHCLKELVAIKIVKNKPKLTKQSAIEIKILSAVAGCEGIVKLKDSFVFRSHTCMVFEILQMNLYEFSRLHKFTQMSLKDLQAVARQILIGIKSIHDKGIIHCDLKPENVLFSNLKSMSLKIIDFGSSCYCNEKIYNYIQSRFYRAPEVILGIPYSFPIDMWSFGCILVEMYVGYPLFPGENEMGLVQKIVETLGLPSNAFLSVAKRKKLFFEEDRGKNKERFRGAGKRTLVELIGTHDLEFIDFLKDIITWDPKARITVNQALDHNWMQKNYNKHKKPFKESYFRADLPRKKIVLY